MKLTVWWLTEAISENPDLQLASFIHCVFLLCSNFQGLAAWRPFSCREKGKSGKTSPRHFKEEEDATGERFSPTPGDENAFRLFTCGKASKLRDGNCILRLPPKIYKNLKRSKGQGKPTWQFATKFIFNVEYNCHRRRSIPPCSLFSTFHNGLMNDSAF